MKPIAITLGEPAGIGPDILLKLAAHSKFSQPLVVIADRNLLHERATTLKINITLPEYNTQNKLPLSLLHIPLQKKCVAGKPDPANSAYVLQTLQRATQACLQKEFSALVTGPVNKAVINQAGFQFRGHTEYLAELTHTKKAVMLFVYQHIKLALLTTHLPLAEVPAQVTPKNILTTLKIMQHDLQKYFKIAQPRIAVTGLNPHAGENGYLGQEEITIIEPTLNTLRQQGFSLVGPLSADTVFHWMQKNPVDALLCMYHDQSLPVIKTLGFGDVSNVTLGLPIIRTSVDHGTAFELAGTKLADETSLCQAIQLAIQMVQHAYET